MDTNGTPFGVCHNSEITPAEMVEEASHANVSNAPSSIETSRFDKRRNDVLQPSAWVYRKSACFSRSLGLVLVVAVLTTLMAVLHHDGLATVPLKATTTHPPATVSQPLPPPPTTTTMTRRSAAVNLGSEITHDENEKSGSPRPLVSGNLTCSDVYNWLPFISPRSNASTSAAESRSIMLVQVVNEGYLKIQENFLAFMERSAPYMKNHFFLLCMDDASISHMADLGVRCVTVDDSQTPEEKKRSEVWVVRVKVTSCLLEMGNSVILSDNDAVWFKDPIKELDQIEGDVIGSRAPWPAKLGDPIFGVTLCMGFIFFREGARGMPEFQQLLEDSMVEKPDDQISVNKAVAGLKPVYNYNITTSDMRFKESAAPGRCVLTALPGTFRVTLLPHSTYTRFCQDVPITDDTVVGHCHNWGSPERRIQYMKQAGTWILDK